MTRRHRLPARRSPARLRPVMRKEPLDFIGIDYSIGNRGAEQAIIPLVLDRRIGVVAYFPFDAGGLFQRAGATPLPAWAADFDAKTWGQFFVKYAISQPASRPSPWSAQGRARRSTCSTTSAAAGALTLRRVGSALHVKVGSMEETLLVARSQTRFSNPWGAIIEFQLDAAGTVTGLILAEGQLKSPATRIR